MKETLVRILKKLHLYIPSKRLKDKIQYLFQNDSLENVAMLKFYSRFIKKKDICFDIGANKGSRIKIFYKLGARVVAVEPQESCMKILRKNYGGNPNIKLLKAGVGSEESIKEMKICNASEFSSFSDEQVTTMKNLKDTHNLEWYKSEKIKIITLDKMIALFGMPNFVKIDVEGYEKEVLKGLSIPIPFLSFEYNTLLLNNATDCIKILSKIGKYKFNYSIKESFKLESQNWLNKEEIIKVITHLDKSFSFGDIYAKLNKS